MSYHATKTREGHLVIHDVPIFVACKRGDLEFNEDWVRSAVARAKMAESEGYLPPLHVRHHEGMASEDPARRAGYFRITGAKPMHFKGKPQLAVFADLVITDPEIEADVIAMRLPYRSVEIFDPDGEPEINSLALLDHEAPYLQLRMLHVSRIDETGASSVAYANFANPYLRDTSHSEDAVVACFRHDGGSATLFLAGANENMTIKSKKGTESAGGVRTAQGKAKAFKFAEDSEGKSESESKDDDTEKMEDGEGLDVASVVSAIKSGAISVADMEAILMAIGERRSEVTEEVAEEPAAAPTPSEAMKNNSQDGVQFARMHGEIQALKMQIAERDAADRRKADVAAAVARFSDRPMGSDFESDALKFHKEHGPKAFADFVESLDARVGQLPDSSHAAANFSQRGAGKSMPKEVSAYAELGSDAVNEAMKLHNEHAQLARFGMRTTAESYIRQGMNRAGFSLN